jgi:hypothetical protein
LLIEVDSAIDAKEEPIFESTAPMNHEQQRSIEARDPKTLRKQRRRYAMPER